ncbi:MAG: aldo/keto reductase [Methylacidiphilales bacterium]|nr:aldo/keto reductase [Candidatus Methylacidiphilales bacterium]
MTLPVAFAVAPSLLTQTAFAADAPASVDASASADVLPKRQLGKNGPMVTMLSMGGMMAALSPDYIDIAWSMGIRYFDTSSDYLGGQSEKIFAQWLAKYPERRKEIFLVSKDHPGSGPEQLLEMIDNRLAACGTTYLDALYIHGIGPGDYGQDSLNWPKSDAFKKTAEALKASGKVKMVGFSCHDGRLTDYLNAAAEGGFVDIIMLAYNPFYPKGGPLDLALDAVSKAGIGLVAMKTMRNTGDVPKRLPEFDKLGLTVHQAVLHSVWSDPRISAVCNMIDNVDQMTASTAAARSYKAPLNFTHMDLLKQTILASRRTMCTGCPSCEAFAKQTRFAFHDIARFVTYYEQDGNTGAREFYQALPAEARDASRVDLAALRDGCHFKTDYPEIIRRAERYFA